ncbi:MAG: hypothetical protein NTZ48_04700, partial [Candidatus Omnitrophica bacterium]|nr:hypothetical protein [Candidatus Omnitrophota bacterium]
GVEVVKDSVYYLNQDYVSALRNLVDQGGIDKVEKYGWGGLLYHFINPENRERSKIDVEMSSMDTQLMRVYALYPAVEFGGDIARKAYEIFDAFDYSENSPFFRNNDKGYGHGWHLVPDVAANDEPTGLMNNMEYHGDERLILDLARMIGLGRARSYYPETTAEYQAINSEYLNAVDHLYAEGKQIGSTDLTGKFYPTWQGASWTYEYAHSIFDFRNKYDKNGVTEDLNWFTNSVKGLLANRLYALEQGNEPYQAVIGSQEVPVEGYVMHYGSLPSISRILSPDSPSSVPSSDGTFSPSQTNLSFTPFESLESLWMQYLSNPMLAQGRYGFRDSFNEEANFWAPGNYLLNEAQFLFKTENALTGLVWDTLGRDPYVAQVMKDAFDQGDAIQEVNDLANLTDFQGSTFEDASFLVGSIIEEAKKMVEVQDESKLEYFRDFINNNDNLYQKALDILNTLAPSVETEALKCVIYKNQKQPDELLYVAGNLITELNNNPGKLADAVDIISKYDYEATVMWKGYDSVNGFIPVMSHVDDDGTIDIKGEIENNLQRAIALNSPNELLPEELRELLTTQRKLYTLFSEDAGVISTLIEGANLSNGKHIKGFRELAEEKGLIGARQIFTEEFEALSALRSYVEFSLGRELNLLSPTGEDSGYLSGLSNMIEGGLQELGGWQQFLRWMAKDGSGSYTFEEVADDLLVTGQLRAFQELWFGRPLDLVNSDADNTNLSPYVKKVTQEGKSIELQISHMLSETPTRYCDLNISSIQGLIVQGKDMYEYTTHMRANINPLGGSYQYKLEVTVSYENGAQKVYTFNNLNGSRAQEVTVPLYDDPNIFLDSVTIGGVTRDLYILSHPKNIVFRIIEGGGE